MKKYPQVVPAVWGIAGGVVGGAIVAFSFGWVTTMSNANTMVQDANIATLASFCSATAGRIAAAESTDLTTLKGYDNRVKREELVKAAMADMEVPEVLKTKVTSSCNRTLA
jgi:ABC-type uncharacterized transport system permease subunit